MSNPSGPDQENQPSEGADRAAASGEQAEPSGPAGPAEQRDAHDAETEVFAPPAGPADPQPAERRFTAPSGFDGSTQKIGTPPPDPATEVFAVADAPAGAAAAGAATEPFNPQKMAAPQHIPPRDDAQAPRRSWGWVIAVVLVIAALVAIAVLALVLLTRGSDSRASQEDQVRTTIQNFDVAIQNGDLATLRTITCGATRDSYVRYDDEAWEETHARVAAAKQYPVVASIDQVVINGDHAEANVTTFMAYAPQTRSTRSFDLEFRDEQWKICQAPQ